MKNYKRALNRMRDLVKKVLNSLTPQPIPVTVPVSRRRR